VLKIVIPGEDFFDEVTNEFIKTDDFVLELEHSLVSLSKWESISEKPFLGNAKKTPEETFGYIQAMCLTPDVPLEVFLKLTDSHIDEINKYIEAKMTATWFRETRPKAAREIITSELIYYWMISMNIPMECEHWHLNRLFTLIKVFSEKNTKQPKMSKSEIGARNRALNEARKKQYGTTG
jgi:hypothetical protein